jgi:hypothetical protein
MVGIAWTAVAYGGQVWLIYRILIRTLQIVFIESDNLFCREAEKQARADLLYSSEERATALVGVPKQDIPTMLNSITHFSHTPLPL